MDKDFLNELVECAAIYGASWQIGNDGTIVEDRRITFERTTVEGEKIEGRLLHGGEHVADIFVNDKGEYESELV